MKIRVIDKVPFDRQLSPYWMSPEMDELLGKEFEAQPHDDRSDWVVVEHNNASWALRGSWFTVVPDTPSGPISGLLWEVAHEDWGDWIDGLVMRRCCESDPGRHADMLFAESLCGWFGYGIYESASVDDRRMFFQLAALAAQDMGV